MRPEWRPSSAGSPTPGTADETASHLQIEIARLSRLVAVFATGLGAVFFAPGAFLGLPFWANLMFAIGIIVANVPKVCCRPSPSRWPMATQRMARRSALIHLPAVETPWLDNCDL